MRLRSDDVEHGFIWPVVWAVASVYLKVGLSIVAVLFLVGVIGGIFI